MYNISNIREGVGHHTKRQDFAQTVSRKHFITKQDVRNTRRSVSDRLIKRHDNDAMSDSILVREIQQKPFNPVLIHKPQGMILEEFPTLAKKSSVLAVQREFQMEIYRKFCNKILCIDSTHSTNAYRFKLIAYVVPNKFGQPMTK